MEYLCAFTGVDRVLGVERVHKRELVNVGRGVMVSEYVVIEGGLEVDRYNPHASLSHQRVFALYTSLLNGRQVEMKEDNWTNVTFYDDNMIVPMLYRFIREEKAGEIFKKPRLFTFKNIRDVRNVDSNTDTSLLYTRRVLHYKLMGMGHEILAFFSSMGIDCGMEAMFQSLHDWCLYTLNWDNEVILLREVGEREGIMSLSISSTHPRDSSKAMLKYRVHFIKRERRIGAVRSLKLKRNL